MFFNSCKYGFLSCLFLNEKCPFKMKNQNPSVCTYPGEMVWCFKISCCCCSSKLLSKFCMILETNPATLKLALTSPVLKLSVSVTFPNMPPFVSPFCPAFQTCSLVGLIHSLQVSPSKGGITSLMSVGAPWSKCSLKTQTCLFCKVLLAAGVGFSY